MHYDSWFFWEITILSATRGVAAVQKQQIGEGNFGGSMTAYEGHVSGGGFAGGTGGAI